MPEAVKRSISCGSKLFVLGEYLALTGGPSLVAAIEPSFALLPSTEDFVCSKGSPAARLLMESGGLGARLHDPLAEGDVQVGGIGRSTAEFALALYALGTRDVKEAYEHYRRITSGDSSLAPSGYDLVAQWLGGAHWITGTRPDELDCESVKFPLEWRFLVFSAGHLPERKTATHLHLQSLGDLTELDRLRPSIDLAREAIRTDDLRGMGEALNHFADEIYAMGLENQDAHEDRNVLNEIPGVAGVKGCGAALSDTILVLLSEEGSPRAVIDAAEARGLKLLSTGLRLSPGIRVT